MRAELYINNQGQHYMRQDLKQRPAKFYDNINVIDG